MREEALLCSVEADDSSESDILSQDAEVLWLAIRRFEISFSGFTVTLSNFDSLLFRWALFCLGLV